MNFLIKTYYFVAFFFISESKSYIQAIDIYIQEPTLWQVMDQHPATCVIFCVLECQPSVINIFCILPCPFLYPLNKESAANTRSQGSAYCDYRLQCQYIIYILFMWKLETNLRCVQLLFGVYTICLVQKIKDVNLGPSIYASAETSVEVSYNNNMIVNRFHCKRIFQINILEIKY